MARTVKINPWVYDGDEFLARDTLLADTSAKTWTANTPYVLSSGLVTPVTSSTTTGIKGILLEDVLTVTAADIDVKVARITGRVRWAGYISNDDNDAAESDVTVGTAYGIRVANNGDSKSVVTINKNDTSGAVFIVDDVMSNRNPLQYATTDSPGVCIGRYTQAVIDG